MQIEKHMTRDPVTVRPEQPLPQAWEVLRSRDFRHLPVVDGRGRLVGMVTDRDLRSASPSSVLPAPEQAADLERLAQATVGSIMTRAPLSLPLSATVDDALLLLDRGRFGALPVVDRDGRVVGIFSTRDLLRAYRGLFGVAEAGSALVEVRDDGRPRLLSRIAGALEEHGIPCTRLVRVEGREGEPGTAFVRVQTYNLHAVHELLRGAGLAVELHKGAAAGGPPGTEG